jgi:hypothetical protein
MPLIFISLIIFFITASILSWFISSSAFGHICFHYYIISVDWHYIRSYILLLLLILLRYYFHYYYTTYILLIVSYYYYYY